jgi:lysophospholipase L1-like esterase
MIKNFKWLLLASLTFVACNNEDETVVVADSSDGLPLTAGTADFSKYVALGDSFAAGYSDGALFIKGQEGAYPNVMAQQFALVGGGAFTTPLMADNIGGFSSGGNQISQFPTRRYFDTTISFPVNVSGVTTTAYGSSLTGAFNNMGIPGAKSFHLGIAGYKTLNPYFGRFASSVGAKVIDDAMVQKPTFFSLWIGGNDVLSYAMSGGTGVNQTGNFNPATYGSNDITDPNVFAGAFSGLVNALTTGGSKGVVANLPYVSTLPFFTTVPTNPIPLDAATAGALNGLFSPLNGILAAYGQAPRFATLAAGLTNPLLIIDESLPDYTTQITAALTAAFTPSLGAAAAAAKAGLMGSLYGQAKHASNVAATKDYILLTAKADIGTTQAGYPAGLNVVGVSFPMQDATSLTADEISKIKTATDAYNVTIKAVATAKGLAFVDTKAVMDQLVNGGISANGFTVTAAFVSGGGFSLDGIHPSPRGYALIANKFMEAINGKYGSNLKGVDLGKYRILFPKLL